MPISSKDYVLALRQGNFLRFLDWPSYIVANYSKQNQLGVSADELVELLIFDWFKSGYCEDDLAQFAALYSVYALASSPLKGALEYALTMLFSALVNCMVYSQSDSCPRFAAAGELDKDGVVAFVRKQSDSWERAEYEQALHLQRCRLLLLASKTPEQTVKTILGAIMPIITLRTRVENYLAQLEDPRMPANQLKDARIGVLKRLKAYLNEQHSLTDLVKEEIALYVHKIADLAPEEFERGLLDGISPPTFAAIAWQFFSSSTINLLHLVQGRSSQADDSAKPS